MSSTLGREHCTARRFWAGGKRRFPMALASVALAGGLLGGAPAPAQEARPDAAMLLDRLCADTLRHNEEDRLFALISITVRTTIKYTGGIFDPDLIDDAIQDSLAAITAACPQIKAIDDPHRLGRAVELARDATIKRMQDPSTDYNPRQIDKASAADLSEELSAQEIDAWLDALPPRRRAMALLLYTAGLSHAEMADAVGMAPSGLAAGFREAKTDLLTFFRAESDGAAAPAPGPAMQYRVAGQNLAGLLQPPPARPEPDKAEANAPEAKADDTRAPGPKPPGAVRITAISSDLYAGWSLLATVTGLAPGRGLDIADPILVEPDRTGHRRMIVTAADEISDPKDDKRRFLLKAFAIDGDREGATLRDSFHLGAAAVDNPQARETLHNPRLAAIEIARCLWHDYGTGPDPGMCR